MNARPLHNDISPQWREITHEQVADLDRAATNGASWDFYCGSYIHHPTVCGNKMSGLVQDAVAEYFAEIRVDQNRLIAGCNCGERTGICKHAVALLYSWVDDGDGFLNVADALKRLRHKDKEDLLAILGRLLMLDPRNLSLLDENSPVGSFEEDDL